MVRTKADAGSTKVCAAKAPRKVVSTGGGSSGASPCRPGSSKDKYSGGNAYNPQPIPNWQKGISAFFKSEISTKSIEEPSSSKNMEPAVSLNSSAGESSSIEGESSNSNNAVSSFEENGLISDE